MDEAALQEAAIHHASLSTEKPHPQAQAAYLETSPQHQLEKSKHAVKGLEEAVGASENNDEDDDDDEDDEDDGKQSHRRLRASGKEKARKGKGLSKVSTQAKVDHQVKDDHQDKDHQELFDPVAWAQGSPSDATSMEKQLTDLMMSGKLAGTPFGKSVEQISHLIEKDMMVKVEQAHKANQDQLNKEVKDIHECGKTKSAQVAIANKEKGLYLKTSPLHKTCRAGEAGKQTEKTENYNEMRDKERIKQLKCKEFAMVSKKYGDQQANGQIVKKGGSEQTESYVRRLTSTICGKYPPGGKGGGGKGGFLDIFMIAKEACEKATKEYNAQVKKYNIAAKEYEDKKAQCDSLQDQMDGASCKRATVMKDACESYAECYWDRKRAHDSTVKMVKTEETDRKAEWKGLKRMQCLMNAFKDGQVSGREIRKCKEKTHDTSHLTINYPPVPALVTCTVPKLYPSTPEYKLAEFAPLPALAKGKEDANECTGVTEINTKPAKGSPSSCKCERVTLNGPYSPGPLVKCTNCTEARRSSDRNSCPEGTKLFSPRSASDWKTIISSVGELRDPYFVVDVTTPKNGCGFCNRKAMNSDTPQGTQWLTSDRSPWWLRSTKFKEPNGDGQPNCYVGILPGKNDTELNEDNIEFASDGCKFYSKSYYCQLKEQSMVPKAGSPESCTCKPVTLTGTYSAGALIKCTKCLDVSRSMQKNSCPVGTKIFSPASSTDWKTFLASAKPLRSPQFIIDITRPQNGCGGCKYKPMNSKTPSQMTWRTADGSPWWLRSSLYSEPNGDYSANCYMDLWKTAFSETNIMFNDWKCKYHSDSYYCQPVKKKSDFLQLTSNASVDAQ